MRGSSRSVRTWLEKGRASWADAGDQDPWRKGARSIGKLAGRNEISQVVGQPKPRGIVVLNSLLPASSGANGQYVFTCRHIKKNVSRIAADAKPPASELVHRAQQSPADYLSVLGVLPRCTRRSGPLAPAHCVYPPPFQHPSTAKDWPNNVRLDPHRYVPFPLFSGKGRPSRQIPCLGDLVTALKMAAGRRTPCRHLGPLISTSAGWRVCCLARSSTPRSTAHSSEHSTSRPLAVRSEVSIEARLRTAITRHGQGDLLRPQAHAG